MSVTRGHQTDKVHDSRDGSLTMSEIGRRERAFYDSQTITVRCEQCPDWAYTGPAGEARAAASLHRDETHPKTKTGRGTDRARVDREAAWRRDRAAADSTVEEPEPQPTRPGSEPPALAEPSGSSTAAPNPGPEAAMPTMKRPPKPRGYWTLDRVIEGFKEHHRRTGSAPATSLLNGSQGPVPEYLPAYTNMRKVATYESVLAAAGLEAPARAKPTAKAETASPRVTRQRKPRVVKTVVGVPPAPAGTAESLVELAQELEASKAELDKAQDRYLAARAAIRNHDSVREAA